MSDMKQDNRPHDTGFWKVLPFFLVLGMLTVASFVISLRPTVSYAEKRELAKFPEFTLPRLADGSYFDEITTWFSDTFPGRETWLEVADYTASLHGYSSISFASDFVVSDSGQTDTSGDSSNQVPTRPPTEPTQDTTPTEDTEPTEEQPTQPTETEPEEEE